MSLRRNFHPKHAALAALAALGVTSVFALQADAAVVERVVDGDTVALTNGDRVRILGIDTPERGDCGFGQATRLTARLTEGRPVKLIGDSESDDKDRYGRLLRYVEVPMEGTDDVGLRLLRAGWASAYRGRYEVERSPRYFKAERNAARRGVGVWEEC
jgi:endonuclease YncB( thermonuclease family)